MKWFLLIQYTSKKETLQTNRVLIRLPSELKDARVGTVARKKDTRHLNSSSVGQLFPVQTEVKHGKRGEEKTDARKRRRGRCPNKRN